MVKHIRNRNKEPSLVSVILIMLGIIVLIFFAIVAYWYSDAEMADLTIATDVTSMPNASSPAT